MTRFPGLVLLFACLFATHSAVAKSATDWHVVKVGSRDYLSVDNVAKFYGLLTISDPILKKGAARQRSQ